MAKRGMRQSDVLYHILFPHAHWARIIRPDFWVDQASWLDFCINVLGNNLPMFSRSTIRTTPGTPIEEWPVYQALAKHAGWIFPFKNCNYSRQQEGLVEKGRKR